MNELPFGQQLLLELVGPVVTVALGFLAIQRIAERGEDKRAAASMAAENMRAANALRAEDARAENAVRHSLVAEMAESASSLYLETQRYWRAKRRSADEAQLLLPALELVYLESRNRGEILERQLARLLPGTAARRDWHAVMDLLTVRYFQLQDAATPQLRKANQGADHSGLDVDELGHAGKVLAAYRERLDNAIALVNTTPLSMSPGHSTSGTSSKAEVAPVAAHDFETQLEKSPRTKADSQD